METNLGKLDLATQNYNRDGYFLFKNFFHKQDIESILEECKDVFANQFLFKGYRGSFMSNMQRLFAEDKFVFSNCGKHVQHLVNLHRLSLNVRLIKILQRVAGIAWPSICTRPVVFFNHPSLASERIYHTVDAHQDWKSMQGSANAAVVWIPLTDCPRTIGPLQLLPGSHKAGLRTTRVVKGFGMVDLSEEERSRLVSVECEAGDIVLFHSMLVHQSGSNKTSEPRWSAHFRYNDLDDQAFIKRGYVHPYIYKPVDEIVK